MPERTGKTKARERNQSGATLWAAIAVLVLSVVPYVQTRHFGLVWDDPTLLETISHSGRLGGVAELFDSDFRIAPDRPLGYYRPVTTTSLWLQIKSAFLSGGPDPIARSAPSMHIVNLLLHAASSLLVWLILRRMKLGAWPAFLGAALFATHPVHVESVAFISGRTDLLAATCVLASLLCWLDARTAHGSRRTVLFIAAALMALAGALSKEQALLLPAVLLIWSGREKRGWWQKNRLWLACYFAAMLIALWLRSRAGVGFGPGDAHRPFSFLFMGPRALLLYIKLWFAPWPLNNYYMPVDLAPDWIAILSVLATGGLVALAVRHGRRYDAVVACSFALIFLIPVLHIRPFNGAVAAARFYYLSSAGLALLTAIALASLEKMKTARLAGQAIVGGAVVAGLILSTIGARSWASNATLYTHMVETSPRSAISHRGLAEVLMKNGKLDEAAEHCRIAIKLDPTFADGHELLGVLSARQHDYETARAEFEIDRTLRPQHANVYKNLGMLALQQRNAPEAVDYFRHAATLEPLGIDTHYYLGVSLAANGDMAGAAHEAEVLDALDPARAAALRKRVSRSGSPAAPAPR